MTKNKFNFKGHEFIKKKGERQNELNVLLECVDYVCKKCGAQLRDGYGKYSYFWSNPKINIKFCDVYNLLNDISDVPGCDEIIIKSIIE